jgi:hypothetical protein
MAIKPSEITKEMIVGRADLIIDAALRKDSFQLALGVKQLSNWSKAKRRQTFRLVLKSLLGGRNYWGKLSNIIRPLGISYWHIQADIVINEALARFVKQIQELEKTDRFMPEKTLTISSLNVNLFLGEPEVLEYLFDNNILVLSDKIQIKGANFKMTTNIVSNISLSIHNFQNVINYYKSLNMNTDVLLDPRKLGVKISYNIQKNTRIVSKLLLEKGNARTSAIARENIEKIAALCSNTMKELAGDYLNVLIKSFRSTRIQTYKELASPYINTFISQADVEAASHDIIIELHKLSIELHDFLFSETIQISNPNMEIVFDPSEVNFSA